MDKKLTDSEIVRALEDLKKCNNNEIDCGGCSLSVFYPRCPEEIGELSFDLINRLQAENEVLESRIGVYETCNARKDEAIRGLETENERLQSILLSFTSEVETWSNKKGYDTTELSLIAILDEATNIKAEIKAEAYKECIEKVKDNSSKLIMCNNGIPIKTDYQISGESLDNLLKELGGEDK